jgi:hypothetical protein
MDCIKVVNKKAAGTVCVGGFHINPSGIISTQRGT